MSLCSEITRAAQSLLWLKFVFLDLFLVIEDVAQLSCVLCDSFGGLLMVVCHRSVARMIRGSEMGSKYCRTPP